MRRLPWLLLAVSVVLNLSMLAGFFYTEHAARRVADPALRLVKVSEALSLTPEQFEAFKTLQDSLWERRQMFREYMEPVRRGMTEALMAESFDRESYRQVMSKRQEVREEYFLQVGEELHDFLQSLSPEQRAAFKDLAKERRFLWRFLGGRAQIRNVSVER
ncbi:MAG: Spy/CpxP family protein refolding chaperone [Kiloniellales bacterium]|nr:Spy/CpxP family protein refolding chaperone [Kiloniellales bacterium]